MTADERREYKKLWARKKRGTVIKEPVTRQQQLDRMKQWRIDNPDQFRAAREKWAAENKDRVRDANLKYALAQRLGCRSSEIPVDLWNAHLAVTYVIRKVKELSK